VTRKITMSVAAIKQGRETALRLGNLDAKRGLGLREGLRRGDVADPPAGRPGDYVIATGETHSVREFCEEAFACVGSTGRTS